MPALKSPVVYKDISAEINIILDNTDYGEFHPTVQIRSISDNYDGGVFKGVGFDIMINRDQAKNYIRLTEKMKPTHRIKIDAALMTDDLFAKEIFNNCI